MKVKGVVGRGIGRITCWFKCRLTGKSLSKRGKGAVNNVLVIKKIRAFMVLLGMGLSRGMLGLREEQLENHVTVLSRKFP